MIDKLNLRFRPKLLDSFQGYTRGDLAADLTAGVTVGIIALPLAMAFGIASGVQPGAGIYTAIIAGFLISFLGGSRVSVGGPTGAFVGIVYAIVATHGLQNLIVCTILAGLILVVMGLARFGGFIKFIPFPVISGFTTGIAVVIFSTQIKDFFGLKTLEKVPAEFAHKAAALFEHLPNLHWPTLLLAVGSAALIFTWPRKFARRVPGSIVALALSTAAVMLLDLDGRYGLETIGSKFGGIPQSLPPLSLPDFAHVDITALIRPALTIALLAAIESLLCAVVADGMINDRHDSNQELFAQGIANIASGLFGGIPATGAIARTAANVNSGARSPIAGMVHAIVLLLIILVAAPLAKDIPLATLSAVLVAVAYNMGEWRQFARLTKWPKSDAIVLIATFTLTVVADLVVAVEIGMLLTAGFFIKRMAETSQVRETDEEPRGPGALAHYDLPPGVQVYHIFGAFFFGAADKLETALKRVRQEPTVLILNMQKAIAMDATGLNALEELFAKLKRRHQHLIIAGLHTQPLFMLSKAGFLDELTPANLCGNMDEAIARSRALLGLPETQNPLEGSQHPDA